MTLKGIDANYVLMMENLGLKWLDQDGNEIEDIFHYFRSKGAECIRVRIWVGSSGPSRLSYAIKVIERSCKVGLKIQPVIFLSDGWADLYKQPEPKFWSSPSFQDKLKLVRKHVSEVMDGLKPFEDSCLYYQIGNEIDYGICGVFASNKKRRKNIKWLKERIWRKEAEILKESIKVIRNKYCCNKPVALHLGKWWDQPLFNSFLSAMKEFKVEYEMLCISFYPTGLGVNFEPLKKVKETLEAYEKIFSIAEYAYPSGPMKGQFWFMNKPSEGYPLTSEGQSSWIKDFLHQCRTLGVYGAFYWSPELYLTKSHRGKIPEPEDMPLTFGWGPMSFFNEMGKAKPCVGSLAS